MKLIADEKEWLFSNFRLLKPATTSIHRRRFYWTDEQTEKNKTDNWISRRKKTFFVMMNLFAERTSWNWDNCRTKAHFPTIDECIRLRSGANRLCRTQHRLLRLCFVYKWTCILHLNATRLRLQPFILCFDVDIWWIHVAGGYVFIYRNKHADTLSHTPMNGMLPRFLPT